MLRGLAREAGHWNEVPEALAAATGLPVACLDLPGAGREAHRASPTRIEAIAADLRGRARPAWIVANSLGGMVTMALAADPSPGLRGVVLVNTSAADLGPPWRRMSPGALWGVLRAIGTRDPERRERAILDFTTRRCDRAAIARRWARIATERPMRRIEVLRQLWAASRFRAPARLGVPALVIGAEHDRLAHVGNAVALARRYDAALEIHPEAGHDVATDDPEWFVGVVGRWIGSRV